MRFNDLLKSSTVLIGFMLHSAYALALEPVYTSWFNDTALDGFDAVSYFTDGKPQKGERRFTHDYQGARWYFANEANLSAFQQAPARYAPQYGGYCAWAVAQGYDAPGNPLNWKIVDGKLYLNYDDKVQRTWEANIRGFIKSADANWPKLLSE